MTSPHSSTQSTPKRRVSMHEVWFEPPDTLCWKLVNTVTAQDAEAFEAFNAEHPSANYLLIDLTAKVTFDAGARKRWSAGADAANRELITAVFGGSLPIRTVAKLLVAALEVVRPGGSVPRTKFFDTEREARDWIALHRSNVVD